MPETYKHPDTGEEVEIPEGAEIRYTDDGEIFSWSQPPETPEGELHPTQVEDYEYHFDPLGLQRRVLAFVTDESDWERGPRNTAERVAQELDQDPFSAFSLHTHDIQEYLDELEASGLVSQEEEDGKTVYRVTEAGQVELSN